MASGYRCLIARCCCMRGVSVLLFAIGGDPFGRMAGRVGDKCKKAATIGLPGHLYGDKLLIGFWPALEAAATGGTRLWQFFSWQFLVALRRVIDKGGDDGGYLFEIVLAQVFIG